MPAKGSKQSVSSNTHRYSEGRADDKQMAISLTGKFKKLMVQKSCLTSH